MARSCRLNHACVGNHAVRTPAMVKPTYAEVSGAVGLFKEVLYLLGRSYGLTVVTHSTSLRGNADPP